MRLGFGAWALLRWCAKKTIFSKKKKKMACIWRNAFGMHLLAGRRHGAAPRAVAARARRPQGGAGGAAAAQGKPESPKPGECKCNWLCEIFNKGSLYFPCSRMYDCLCTSTTDAARFVIHLSCSHCRRGKRLSFARSNSTRFLACTNGNLKSKRFSGRRRTPASATGCVSFRSVHSCRYVSVCACMSGPCVGAVKSDQIVYIGLLCAFDSFTVFYLVFTLSSCSGN